LYYRCDRLIANGVLYKFTYSSTNFYVWLLGVSEDVYGASGGEEPQEERVDGQECNGTGWIVNSRGSQ